MKILVLDDQQYRHDTFARRFKRIGAQVVHAYDCDQAAEALARDHFDVAYLDYDLDGIVPDSPGPILNGYYTAELIARMPEDYRPNKVVIHSWSESGAQRMADVLMQAGVHVEIERFFASDLN